MLTPGPLRFRDATEADLEDLLALLTSAYRGDASRVGWTTEADLLDGERIDREVLLADMRQPRSRVLLAESGDALLACAHVAELGGGGYFGMFAVRPELQGGGLGKAVLAEMPARGMAVAGAGMRPVAKTAAAIAAAMQPLTNFLIEVLPKSYVSCFTFVMTRIIMK